MRTIVRRLKFLRLANFTGAFVGSLFFAVSVAQVSPELESLQQQRDSYRQAQLALSQRQMKQYHLLNEELTDYPLLPYLQFQEMSQRLKKLSSAEVTDFLNQYPSSYLAEQLRYHWLHQLAEVQRWEEYLQFYHSGMRDTRLHCYHLRARVELGDKSALEKVAPLWNVSESQPEVCDPLFAQWMAAGLLTPQIAWERHSKALQARNRHLAAYVARQLPEDRQKLARLYREVDAYPTRLRQQHRFGAQTAEMQEIILHGLERLARRDAPEALNLWHKYDAQQLFDDRERLEAQHFIATRLVYQGHMDQAEQLLARSPGLSSEDLTEGLIRDALKRQDWHKAYAWLERLPPDAQQTERWRYWRARLMEQLQLQPDEGQPSARELYAAVAATRSFYGFLSADILGYEYRLIDKPANVTPELMAKVENLPGIARARELLMLGDLTSANREWYHSTRDMNTEDVIAAGKLAERWGWHRNGIQAMISAQSWDDLQLRFPLAYQEQMTNAAKSASMTPHLLFAIARQESAFMPDARSPAGALGLMQLLPSTAQYTARRAGIPYKRHELLSPETNIDLGSRYLHQLLNEFDGNRILATAAYNAGPTRVRQWLSAEQQKLPYDVWIETIPYRETRSYVQNVLAYSVIYGYRLGESRPFITLKEAQNSL